MVEHPTFKRQMKVQYLLNLPKIGTSSKGRIAHFDCVHDCSNQSVPTKFQRGLAQSGSAPALGAGGRRFKSYNSDHFKNSGES